MNFIKLKRIVVAGLMLMAAGMDTAAAQSQRDRDQQWQVWNKQMLDNNAAIQRNKQLIEEARRAQAQQAQRAASEARARQMLAAQQRAEQMRQEQRRQEIRQQEQLRQAQQRQRGW